MNNLHKHKQLKPSPKQRQRGISLVELLTVVSIVGILAYISAPSYVEAISLRNLNTAKTTLIQTLYRAKNIASTENTIVTVTTSNNQITINPANNSNSNTITLPEKIVFSSENNINTIQFNPLGEVIVTNNQGTATVLTSNLGVSIQAQSNSTIQETITITPMGLILILPPATTAVEETVAEL